MINITLYLLASITVLSSSIVAPAMGEIAIHFSDVDPILIKLILTMPALLMVPGTMLSIKLCNMYGKKKVLYIGLIIYVFGGVITAFMSTIEALLFCRAILGLGVGLITPISQSLPADFYTGVARAKVTGRSASSISLGNMIFSLLTGWLAFFSWRYTFYVYGLGLVVLVFVYFALPDLKNEIKQKPEEQKAKIPPVIYAIAVGMFFFMLAMYGLYTNLAIVMQAKGIGSAASAGYVISTNSFISFLIGLMLHNLHKTFGKYIIVAILTSVGLGFLVLYFASTLPFVFAGAILIAFGMGAMMPTTFLKVSNTVSQMQNVKAMAYISMGMFLGQFASPILLEYLPQVPTLGGVSAIFASLGVSFTTVALCFLVALLVMPNTPKSKGSIHS